MRIAFIVTHFPALSETFILSQITGLIDRGHEVDIYADNPQQNTKIHPDVKEYNLLPRTYYRHGLSPNLLKRWLRGFWLLGSNFYKAPAVIGRSLNFSQYGKNSSSLLLLFATVPFLGKRPYDIIHCHFGPNGVRGTLLREIGVFEGKLITTFYGYGVTVFPRKHGTEIYKQLFEQGDFYTGITKFIIDKVVELGCPKDKIVKLPIGIELSKYTFRERTLNPGETVKIITVARLVEKKGIEYSIKAIAKVVQKHPNLQYQIVGEGSLRESLERLIGELNLGDQVQLLGGKTQDEVRQLYADSHIFILSSVTAASGDQEGQGLVLQEAQAMGLPVLSTIHNGIPEGVLDGKSALSCTRA